MTPTNDTVTGRLETVHSDLSPLQATTLVAFAAAITFVLLFLQEPLAHDSLHHFRHAAGVICH